MNGAPATYDADAAILLAPLLLLLPLLPLYVLLPWAPTACQSCARSMVGTTWMASPGA